MYQKLVVPWPVARTLRSNWCVLQLLSQAVDPPGRGHVQMRCDLGMALLNQAKSGLPGLETRYRGLQLGPPHGTADVSISGILSWLPLGPGIPPHRELGTYRGGTALRCHANNACGNTGHAESFPFFLSLRDKLFGPDTYRCRCRCHCEPAAERHISARGWVNRGIGQTLTDTWVGIRCKVISIWREAKKLPDLGTLQLLQSRI